MEISVIYRQGQRITVRKDILPPHPSHTYTHTYIQAYKHTYIHIHTHTHRNTDPMMNAAEVRTLCVFLTLIGAEGRQLSGATAPSPGPLTITAPTAHADAAITSHNRMMSLRFTSKEVLYCSAGRNQLTQCLVKKNLTHWFQPV